MKDLSLVVDKTVFANEVLETVKGFIAQSIEGFACESVEVFDVYEGEGLEAGKKSFAVSMKFRAQDRTLKDKEVNAVFEAVQSLVLKETNYQIRK
jgi:phenylalanyl-tRNA synthetase beta chain